jgi:tetratricopeptide (TPR) repeat protein
MDDRRNAAVVQSRLGEVAFQSGNLEHALTLLMAASEILKQCVEEDNSQDNRLAYTGCLERLAQIYRSLGDNKTARNYIDIIVPLREQSYAESRSITTALHLAMSYQNACLARAFTGDALGAADACDKNVDLLRALKPHFSPQRATRVDSAIRLMQLFSLLPLLKESGLLGDLKNLGNLGSLLGGGRRP